MLDKIDELFEDSSNPKRKLHRDPDNNFSHLFKELKSEFLIDGDDGNFV